MTTKSEQIKYRAKAILAILHYFNIKHFKTRYNHKDKEVLKMTVHNLNQQDAFLVKYWVEKLPWIASCVLNVSKSEMFYLNIEILI